MTIDQPLKIGFELNSYKIESTSVTRYKALQDCKLKGVLDAKGETKLLAYSINNELGILNQLQDSFNLVWPQSLIIPRTVFDEEFCDNCSNVNSDDLVALLILLYNIKKDFI